MELVSPLLIFLLAIIVISTFCFLISMWIYNTLKDKGIRAAALWRFVAYLLLFYFIVVMVVPLGAIALNKETYLLLLGTVLISSGVGFLVSGGLYKSLLRKEQLSAPRWRFVTFVLSFSILFCAVIVLYLSTLEFQR